MGVVVVKIGDPVGLEGTAAEFADVVARRRSRQQGQIDGQPRLGDLTAHVHGDVVDAGVVAQGI